MDSTIIGCPFPLNNPPPSPTSNNPSIKILASHFLSPIRYVKTNTLQNKFDSLVKFWVFENDPTGPLLYKSHQRSGVTLIHFPVWRKKHEKCYYQFSVDTQPLTNRECKTLATYFYVTLLITNELSHSSNLFLSVSVKKTVTHSKVKILVIIKDEWKK